MQQESMKKRIELRELQRNPQANRERIDRTQRDLGNIERSRDRSYQRYRSDLGQVLDERQRQQYNNYTDSERKPRVGPYRQRDYDGGRQELRGYGGRGRNQGSVEAGDRR